MKSSKNPLITIFVVNLLFIMNTISPQLKAQPYSQYALLPEELFYDVRFYGIDLSVDVNTNSIEGFTQISGEIIQNNTTQIVLNFYNTMNTDSIVFQNQSLNYTHNDNILRIDLPQPLNNGDNFTLTVYYHGSPQHYPPYNSGFNFVTYQGQKLAYTLNWPYFACSYFPCKDHPSDKADSVRIAVTVPANYTVASTGVLVTTQPVTGNQMKYTWESHYPIVPYNICINAYPFDAVNSVYNSPVSGAIPLEYYLFPNHSATAQPRLETEVPRIIEAFETYYGSFPFSSEKFGICELSMAGFGMEHQTLLTMNYNFFFDIELPHEGAHEWFGNTIAIADWGHIWLSEGFATYSQAIFREYWEGPAGYQQEISSHMAASGEGTIFVTKPWDPQSIIPSDLVYNKASTVLHMLRFIMGDSLFLNMLYDYAATSPFRYGNIYTEQFEAFCENYYGSDLNWFFDQWIYHDGKMAAKYYAYWNPTADSLILKAHSVPSSSSSNTFHNMPVPFYFSTNSGQFLDTLWIDSLNLTQRYAFSDTSNLNIQVDPDNKILKGPFNYMDHPVLESAFMSGDSIHVFWHPFFDFTDYEVHLWREDSPGNFVFISSYPVTGFNYVFKPLQTGTYRVAVLGTLDGHFTHLSNYMEVDYTNFPMDLDILVIDETRNGTGTSMLDPTDEEVDTFYDSLLINYQHDQLDIITAGRAPDVFDFAHYKLIIWHYDVLLSQTMISQSQPAIQAYLEAGGSIIFSGMKLLSDLSSDFTAPYLGFNQSTSNPLADFSGALGSLGFSDLPLDTAKITIPSFNNLLRFISVFDTTAAAGTILKFLSNSSNPQFHLKPCGVLAHSVADTTKSAVISLGFPLYFTQFDSAQIFIDKAIQDLITGIKIRADLKLKINTFRLHQNYPNPFNPSTTIEFDLPKTSQVTLKIYNILGEEVATLVSERLTAGIYKYEWSPSGGMASGVYLYRLEAGVFAQTKKLILLK